MELLRNENVKKQFHTILRKFLTKNDDYDVNKFIGGLPVTLEKKDVPSLFYKKKSNYKYTVTQKVDGTRVLMYIGYDESDKRTSGKSRTVCFIDRNMKIYTIRDSTGAILPQVNTREILLDGEIVFFDKDGFSHKSLESGKVKGISFMAFDILFGPENIDINSDGNKIIGQEFSMIVPENNILRTQPWNYINRYDILHKLIVPSKFNKEEPMLTMAFKDVNWFNIELKPIYFIQTLKDKRILYNPDNSGYLPRVLNSYRQEFYNMLTTKFNKKNTTTFTTKKLKLDGLIFTSADTLYTIGPWNNGLNTQFKWKPIEEQTVDFYIIKKNEDLAELHITKDKTISAFQQNYKNVTANVPEYTKTGDIAEFKIEFKEDKKLDFIFVELRKDKKHPNSLRTVSNVLNSFKNPVDINDIYYFLNIEKANGEALKQILRYSSKASLINCVINNKNNFEILDQDTKKNINETIKNLSDDSNFELEIRLGRKRGYFDTNIEKEKFLFLIQKLDTFDLVKSQQDFVDVYAGDNTSTIRSRYLLSQDFNKYIHFESIIKQRISNIDIKLDKILDYDFRVAFSTENKVYEYNTEGQSYRKIRTSYTNSDKSFRIDLTEIITGDFNDRKFNIGKEPDVKFQCEIEILSSNVDIEKLFKLISNLISE